MPTPRRGRCGVTPTPAAGTRTATATSWSPTWPIYRAPGLTAVTVNLQGGAPFGYYRLEPLRRLLAERGIAYTDAELWRGLPGPGSQPC